MSPFYFLIDYNNYNSQSCSKLVVPPGFEPGSWDPEPHMMDHYTKGLLCVRDGISISRKPILKVNSQLVLKPSFNSSRLCLLGLSSDSGRAIRGVFVSPSVSVAVFLSGL
jgi:hypothetical protein